MKGDFTRLTFRPGDHYSGVLQQQGRVQLDSDWNEEVAIGLHRERATTSDLMGSCGAPCDAAAFTLTSDGNPIPAAGCAPGALRLEAGHHYVDGILLEVDAAVPLGAQPDLPGMTLPTSDGRYLAYLDVWEEHLTALERPAIREVALGGPDTATRMRTVWQVKLQSIAAGADGPKCSDFGASWIPDGAASTGRLAAQAAASDPITDPCIIPPGAGFRRLENQLYRVEIHDGSQDAAGNAQTPTYVWSRDNGSVALEVAGIVDKVISLKEPPHDAVLGFAAADWIELSDEGRILRGEPGILVDLHDAQGTELTVTAWSGGPPIIDPAFPMVVRRWDSKGAAKVVRGSWIDLEDGVQVQFEKVATQTYRTGDYWLIPARTANVEGVASNVGGDVEWPKDPTTGASTFIGRQGIEHHYCALATLDRTTSGEEALWSLVSDCRRLFPALTSLTHLVYVGGDGQEAMPGDPLPQPLEVAVWNGGCAIAAGVVEFTTTDGGTLTGASQSGASIKVPISGVDPIASCTWTLNAGWSKHSQRTVATLLDDHLVPVGLPIHFDANLSIASQVAFDPAECDALAGEVTVQKAVSHLAAASSIVAWCGDGQEAMPGDPFPEPIEIEVASACGPTEGAKLEITAEGAGRVAGSVADLGAATATFGITTMGNGKASFVWLPDPDTAAAAQRLQVVLGSAPDGPLEEPTSVCITGQLSIASQVAYDPGDCKVLAKADTVQEALDLLCANAGLYYVSGDGQEAQPGDKVPHALEARVANGRWPVQGVRVYFEVVEGGGTIDGDQPLSPSFAVSVTDANGIARVAWTLGPDGLQRVEARLVDNKNEYIVAYDAQFSDGGAAAEPGIHVKGVRLLADGDLLNDAVFPTDALTEGIQIDLDNPIDPVSAKGKPVMVLTTELPYPEGQAFVGGFQPIVLRGDVTAIQTAIRWIPSKGIIQWLDSQVNLAHARGIETVLTRLVLMGNFIWSRKDPNVFVDGDSFGMRAEDGTTRTDLFRNPAGLLSGDDHRGGTFEMWFWLT